MSGDKYKYFHDNLDNKLGPLELEFVPAKEKNRKAKKKAYINLAAFRSQLTGVKHLDSGDKISLGSDLLSDKSFGMKQTRRRKRKLRNKRRHNKKSEITSRLSSGHI